jgi:K+ transporter
VRRSIRRRWHTAPLPPGEDQPESHVPWIDDASRLTMKEIAPRFWRATARYGFMERPDIPALLETARAGGCGIDLSDVTYYVGHETVVPSDSDKRLREIWRWTLPAAAVVAGGFFIVDSAFLVANLAKIAEGGYVPLLLAAAVYGVMLVWHLGAQAISARLQDSVMPITKSRTRCSSASTDSTGRPHTPLVRKPFAASTYHAVESGGA